MSKAGNINADNAWYVLSPEQWWCFVMAVCQASQNCAGVGCIKETRKWSFQGRQSWPGIFALQPGAGALSNFGSLSSGLWCGIAVEQFVGTPDRSHRPDAKQVLLSSSAKSWAELSEDFRSGELHFAASCFSIRISETHSCKQGRFHCTDFPMASCRTQLEASARKAGQLTLTSREQAVIAPA